MFDGGRWFWRQSFKDAQFLVAGENDLGKEIRETGRNAQGVKLIELRSGEVLQGIAPVISDGEDEEGEAETPAS